MSSSSKQQRIVTSRSALASQKSVTSLNENQSLLSEAYKQQCLRSQSSYQFLDDCTYKVDLQKLYQLKSTCFFNVNMPYCPVLVRVNDELFSYNQEHRFLLQVWDTENNKIFEQRLKYEVTVWNIFYDYLVYKPTAPDVDHEYFHIRNLKQHTTIKVKDFTQGNKTYKHVGFDNNMFYIGNENQIKILNIPDFDDYDASEDGHKIDPDESSIATIVPDGHKIHGFFINENMSSCEGAKEPCILVALETSDNQIDLNMLYLLQAPGNENFDYLFKQFRPLVPRQSGSTSSGFDPVIKYQLVFNEDGIAVGVSQRKSGRVDYYFKGMLCQSQNQGKEFDLFAHDVELSFDETFIQTTNTSDSIDSEAVTKAVSHELQTRMSSSEARLMTDYRIKNVFYQRVKKHCKIFKGFVFLKTYIFVAHGHMLSLFDMKALKFTKHLLFDRDVLQVFRSQVSSSVGNEDFDVCVLLQDRNDSEFLIKFINQKKSSLNAESVDQDVYDVDESLTKTVQGEVLQFDQDRDDNAWTFLLVELPNGECQLRCLHDQELYDITEEFLDHEKNPIKVSKDTNFVFFFSPKDVTEVMIHQSEWFYVYEIHFDENENDIQIKSKECRQNLWVDKSVEEKEREEGPLVEEDNELHSAIRVKKDPNDPNSSKSLMILSDSEYFYVIDMGKHDRDPMKFEQRCAGLFLSDNNYMYTLTHKNQGKGIQSGFRLYDIENCISKASKVAMRLAAQEAAAQNQGTVEASGVGDIDFYENSIGSGDSNDLMSYHLQSVQVGCQGLIDFSHQNQRLVYQSSYDSIEVVPVLHRNTIAFVGMSNRDEYLATKVINDKFIALDKRNLLTSWDIITGKLIGDKSFSIKTSKSNQDYSNYEIYTFGEDHYAYHQDWAARVLLKCKTPVQEEIDESLFFDPSMTKANMRNQISYIKSLKKVFYEFKLVEIIGDKEVKEHLSFVFPHYEDPKVDEEEKKQKDSDSDSENENKVEQPKAKKLQHLFFSSDMQYMFEHLTNSRVFLYKRVHKRDRNDETKVKWELVHRFTQFPTDLAEITQYPFMFSPNFTMYLDVDRKGKKFLVRDSFTQECKFVIPEYILNCRDEPIKVSASRFMWADNQTFKIIRSQKVDNEVFGIERKIAIIEDRGFYTFQEENFNVIPLFDVLDRVQQYYKNHLYFDKCQVDVTDTLNRLRLKYQAYRSAVYIDEKKEHQIYPSIYTVDYGLEKYNGRYVADLSFTFLQWNLMEKLKEGTITVDQIDGNQFKKLVYNILPGGQTVFHRLASDGTKLYEVMKTCHPNKAKLDRPPIETHMPFLENFQGQSPMDLLIKQNDFRTANLMLQYLSSYGLDHHSRALVKTLPTCVSKQLPNMRIYLDSRLLKTKECLEFTKGNLLETIEVTPGQYKSVDPQGVTVASFCLSDETTKIISRGDIETDLDLLYLDIPILHQYNHDVCNEFFSALAETEDLKLFDNKGIQKLIEFRWPLAREFVVKRLFLPFVFFLFTFVAYMGQVYEWRQDPNEFFMFMNQVFMVVLIMQSVYFIGIEFYQLTTNGLSYFSSPWNYLDLIPPILLLVFIPLAITGTFDIDPATGEKQNQTLEASLQATMSLLLWLKFLYFLRIFKSTGYLIKIIIAVCVDMRHFLLILFLTIMAFGDSMRAISTSNLPQHIFIQDWWQSFTYVYRMILGDFNTDPTILEGGPIVLNTEGGEAYTDPNNGFGIIAPYYTWTIFYLCTVLNMIIMLNLLIAIISESFARINQEKEQASFQEKCDIIAENTYLVPQARRDNFCEEGRYLLIATDIQQELDSQTKDTNFLLRETHRKITEATQTMEKRVTMEIEKLRAENDKFIVQRMDMIIKDNTEILDLLQNKNKKR